LVRNPTGAASVLLGRRSDTAAFMPSTYVFPGGAVEADDFVTQPDYPLNPVCAVALGHQGFAIAALRELREETGLQIGSGIDLSPLRYVFRAVTPASYLRRFDARFFVANAAAICGDPDDMRPECPELTDLGWVNITDLGRMALPSITRFVLSGVLKKLPSLEPPAPVPEVGL